MIHAVYASFCPTCVGTGLAQSECYSSAAPPPPPPPPSITFGWRGGSEMRQSKCYLTNLLLLLFQVMSSGCSLWRDSTGLSGFTKWCVCAICRLGLRRSLDLRHRLDLRRSLDFRHSLDFSHRLDLRRSLDFRHSLDFSHRLDLRHKLRQVLI